MTIRGASYRCNFKVNASFYQFESAHFQHFPTQQFFSGMGWETSMNYGAKGIGDEEIRSRCLGTVRENAVMQQ